MAAALEKYCLRRQSGGFVKKAAACARNDVLLLNSYLSSHATTAPAYQDAALLSLLWCLFGRASDLTLVQKQNQSVSSSNVLFARFIRMKTSEEQGLTLYHDEDFVTCPIHVIALALVMQVAPSARILDQIPLPDAKEELQHCEPTPLFGLLERHQYSYPAKAAGCVVKRESEQG